MYKVFSSVGLIETARNCLPSQTHPIPLGSYTSKRLTRTRRTISRHHVDRTPNTARNVSEGRDSASILTRRKITTNDYELDYDKLPKPATEKPYSREWASRILPLFEVKQFDSSLDSSSDAIETDLFTPPERHGLRRRSGHTFDQKLVFPLSFRRARARSQREGAGEIRSSKGAIPRQNLSNELLEQELRYLAHGAPHPEAIDNILTILVEERLTKPNLGHYEARILSQCHPELGSVSNVVLILEEMKRENIPLSAPIWAAVLKVLSVHPDSFLRQRTQSALQQQLVDSPSAMAQLIIIAIIREEQLELAWLEIQELNRHDIKVDTWVWVVFIHALCERSELDTVLEIFYLLRDQNRHVPKPTLHTVLEQASKRRHLDLTKLIWHTYVESMHIEPDKNLCMDAMRTAEVNNDINLVESAYTVLACISHMDNHHSKHSSIGSKAVRGSTTSNSLPTMGPSAEETNRITSNVILKSEHADEHGLKAIEDNADRNSRGSLRPKTPLHASSDLDEPRSMPSRSTASIDEHSIPIGIPTEAKSILARVRASHNTTEQTRHQYLENRRGNLFPLFSRPGHGYARFDPRMALQNPFGWWYPESQVTQRVRKQNRIPTMRRRARKAGDNAPKSEHVPDPGSASANESTDSGISKT